METDITRRQLIKLIQAGGVAITLSNTAAAENGSQNTTTTITTMPDEHGPQRTGKFVVEFDDDKVAGWKTVTISSVSIEQGTYRELGEGEEEKQKEQGGQNEEGEEVVEDDKQVEVTSEPYRREAVFEGVEGVLEMERGCKVGDTLIFDWEMDAADGNSAGKKDVAVTLMHQNGDPVARWELLEAEPVNYEPPDLDASAEGDVACETITVQFDKMIRKEA